MYCCPISAPPITATSLSPATAFASSSALSIPSVTKVYTPPSGASSGSAWVTTNTGTLAGPAGPSAPPPRNREIIGASARDHRPYEVHGLGEELAVAVILAERPLMKSLAAVAHGFFGSDVGRCHKLIQGHADVEDHLGHWSLPASLFVNKVLLRGKRPQATRALTSIRAIGSSGLVPRTSTLVRVAPAIRPISPSAASPESRGISTRRRQRSPGLRPHT